MSNDPIIRLVQSGEWVRGYQHDINDLAVAFVKDDSTVGPAASFQEPHSLDFHPSERAENMSKEMELFSAERFPGCVTIRSNVEPAQAVAFFEAFEKRLQNMDGPPRPLPLVRVVVDPNREVWSDPTLTGDWHSHGVVPEGSAEMVAAGYQPPARTRQEYVGRFLPHDEPGFKPLPYASDAGVYLSGVSPVEQGRILRQTMDRLADPRPEKLQHRELDKQILGHLVTTSLLQRDIALLYAAQSQARTDALVSLMKEAPNPYRPQLAAAAGTAWMLRGESRLASEAILESAKVQDQYVTLAVLTKGMNRMAVDPKDLREELTRAVQVKLDEAESEWHVAKQSDPTRAEVNHAAVLPEPLEVDPSIGPDETPGPEVG